MASHYPRRPSSPNTNSLASGARKISQTSVRRPFISLTRRTSRRGREKGGGGPARNRVVFIIVRRNLGKKVKATFPPQGDDLALCSRTDCDYSPKERVSPSKRPSLDENHPISGRLGRDFGQARGEHASKSP